VIDKDQQNIKFWETTYRIASLNEESKLVDMELEIDKVAIHKYFAIFSFRPTDGYLLQKKWFQSGLQIARRGFQLYSDVEFSMVERERKRTRHDSLQSDDSNDFEGDDSPLV